MGHLVRPRGLLALGALGLLGLLASTATAGTVSFGTSDYQALAPRAGWSRTLPSSSGSSLLSTSRAYSTWSYAPGGSGQTTGNTWSGGAPPADSASLSGFVWYDGDRDGNYAAPDSPIIGARVALFRMSDLDQPVAMVSTAANGTYLFSNVASGSYAVALFYPSTTGGKDSVGVLTDQNNNPVTTGAGTLLAAKDMIVNIALGKGYQGTNYNFGEVVAPISKRLFLTPEPGSLGLMATALLGGGLVWLLRRARRR